MGVSIANVSNERANFKQKILNIFLDFPRGPAGLCFWTDDNKKCLTGQLKTVDYGLEKD